MVKYINNFKKDIIEYRESNIVLSPTATTSKNDDKFDCCSLLNAFEVYKKHQKKLKAIIKILTKKIFTNDDE